MDLRMEVYSFTTCPDQRSILGTISPEVVQDHDLAEEFQTFISASTVVTTYRKRLHDLGLSMEVYSFSQRSILGLIWREVVQERDLAQEASPLRPWLQLNRKDSVALTSNKM